MKTDCALLHLKSTIGFKNDIMMLYKILYFGNTLFMSIQW